MHVNVVPVVCVKIFGACATEGEPERGPSASKLNSEKSVSAPVKPTPQIPGGAAPEVQLLNIDPEAIPMCN